MYNKLKSVTVFSVIFNARGDIGCVQNSVRQTNCNV